MSCSPDGLVKRIAIPIARYDAGGADPDSYETTLWMTNPSALLVAMIAIVPVPDGAPVVDFFGDGSVWQVYPAVPAGVGDVRSAVACAPVFADGRPLPDAFVVDDPVKLLKILVYPAGNGVAGAAWAIATWEPKDACLKSELRDALFSKCSLTIDGGERTLPLSGTVGA